MRRMKIIIVISSIILSVMATNDANLWTEFKKNHSRTYKSLIEEKQRFSIFQKNLRIIEEHNAKYKSGQETYFMGINQFTDMTDEEFQSIYVHPIEVPPTKHDNIFKMPTGVKVPDEIDWRDAGVVTPVKDQGGCGSCWAFGATGAIEGQYAIKYGHQIIVSEEELVECQAKSCDGGHSLKAFKYVKENGISTNASYPYTSYNGEVGACKRNNDSTAVKLIDYVVVPPNEEALKQALGLIGPITVGVDVTDFARYQGGIFNYPKCSGYANHAMLAVGYGTYNGLDYWIVKNSWSTIWGVDGYILMARNQNRQCDIGDFQTYPIVA